MSFYGTVPIKIPVDPEVLDRDPLHVLLGLCRVLGLRYTIEEAKYRGWCVTLETTRDWPGDFYGGSHPRNRGKRSFGTIG